MSQTKILAGGFDADVITGTTALAATPATTDEILISDGGTLKRLDATHMMLSPVFAAQKAGTAQTISNNTNTKVTFGTEIYDPDGTWDASTNHRFTPGVAGYYLISGHVGLSNVADDKYNQLHLYKNGSQLNSVDIVFNVNGADATQDVYAQFSYPIVSDADDYFEIFVRHNHGSNCDTKLHQQCNVNAFKILGAGS
jgi:hypothetical protein